jgi:hypothetical protein
MKLAFLIPMTSNGRDWQSLHDCYLLNYTLKTFLETKDDEYDYHFYLGIDHNDSFFIKNLEELKDIFEKNNIGVDITIYNDIPKGHLTKMWNVLFRKAFDDGHDYFYQCGDDITFLTQHWIRDCTETLVKNNNIGVCGPYNLKNTPFDGRILLTQAMVHRCHMEIFGYFFPETIRNIYCDDWISGVYYPSHFFILHNHNAPNIGGVPRYTMEFGNEFYLNELKNGIEKLNNYLDKN